MSALVEIQLTKGNSHDRGRVDVGVGVGVGVRGDVWGDVPQTPTPSDCLSIKGGRGIWVGVGVFYDFFTRIIHRSFLYDYLLPSHSTRFCGSLMPLGSPRCPVMK